MKTVQLKNKNALHFRFKKLKNWKYFLSNDYWNWLIIDEKNFEQFLNGKKIEKWFENTLIKNWFMRNKKLSLKQNEILLAWLWASRYHKLFRWPVLHIVVVTQACNHNCVYCHASAKPTKDSKYNMDKKTAKKVVETIFESTAWDITIEFQWWEPLMNWDIVKYIIQYAKHINKTKKYNLHLSLVSNLTLMDEEKLEFLVNNNVWISTSLDWPKDLHNTNRNLIWWKNSREKVTYWIDKINKRKKELWKDKHLVWAVATATKLSLKYSKEIIDEYIKLGMNKIFIRPLNPYWFAQKAWEKIGYTQDQYIKFYEKFINYIEKKKKSWIDINDLYYNWICETNLKKVERVNYMEEMSPSCWAGLWQVAYNWDWWIYTCDEWRMLAATWDESFKIGQIDLKKSSKKIYENFILNNVTKIMLYSSMIDYTPWYETHPYSDYIWLCPIFSYATNWTIISRYKIDDRFKLQQFVFDKLLENIN